MILHIDMDAFYAAVELRDNPSLGGKPVVVGGSPTGRGVVAAASYAAREYGIYSAMPASQAVRLCPSVVFVKSRMHHYAKISKQIREIFFSYTSLVEPLSLDEAFLDVGGSVALFGEAELIARQIKDRIQRELGLVASAGVAPNKYIAKVASDLEKPDGLVVVPAGRVREFLDPLPISKIWGVGKQTKKKFDSLGVQTIGQLRNIPLSTLKTIFGINSQHFWRLARGVDSRSVVPDRFAKTISHETTFAADIYDKSCLQAWLLELTDQVARRMRRHGLYGKTVNIKVRFSNFETITRARSLDQRTDSTGALLEIASQLLCEIPLNGRGIRLAGVGVSNLAVGSAIQKSLFDQERQNKSKRLDQATDRIRDRFGDVAVRRATGLEHKIRHRPDPRAGNT